MINPDLSLTAIILIVLCEIILLAFLYFISHFFQVKFGQQTYDITFIAAAALLAFLLAIGVLGVYSYEMITLANTIALIVLIVFGLRLFRIMTGVAR